MITSSSQCDFVEENQLTGSFLQEDGPNIRKCFGVMLDDDVAPYRSINSASFQTRTSTFIHNTPRRNDEAEQ